MDDSILTETMPAAVTAAVIGSQCGSLERLYIKPPDVGLAGYEIAALAVLTRLTCLQVRTSLPVSSCNLV